jgi:tetratricopeptide (TPR) repeat protein
MLACLLSSTAVVADETSFDAGVRAYRDGDFDTALHHFERARAEGPDSDQLSFNLGVTLYRLEHYAAAREVFFELRTRPGMTDIAEYHLGLIAAGLGDIDEAVMHLRAAALSDSVQLRGLVQTALGRLVRPIPASRTAGYTRTGVGFDSNRNRISESLQLEVPESESAYADVYGALTHRFRSPRDTELRGSFYVRDYEVDDALDQTAISLALRKSLRSAPWRLTFSGEFEAATLDDHGLSDVYSLSVEAARRIGSSTLRLRVRPSAIVGGSNYDYLDGQRYLIDLVEEFSIVACHLQLGVQGEANNRRDLAAGDEFYSQSPRRYGPYLRLSRALTRDLMLDLSVAYRHSRFRDDNRLIEDGTAYTARRIEDLALLGLMLRLQLSPSWSLRLDYRYSNNQSSIDQYDYVRHLAALMVEWQY